MNQLALIGGTRSKYAGLLWPHLTLTCLVGDKTIFLTQVSNPLECTDVLTPSVDSVPLPLNCLCLNL